MGADWRLIRLLENWYGGRARTELARLRMRRAKGVLRSIFEVLVAFWAVWLRG